MYACRMLGCLLLAAAALGVAAPEPIDARFTAGAMVFADDGPVTLIAFGGSVRFYFSRRWSVEPEVLYARRYAGFARATNYLLWGKVAFNFLNRHRRIVPYWYGGPGLG